MLQTKIKDNELAQQMLHLVVPYRYTAIYVSTRQCDRCPDAGLCRSGIPVRSFPCRTDPVCPQSLYRRHCCRMRYHYRAILGKKRHRLHRKGHAGSALYQPDLRRDFYRTGFVYSKPPHAIFTNDATLIANGTSYLRAVAFSYVLCGISRIY